MRKGVQQRNCQAPAVSPSVQATGTPALPRTVTLSDHVLLKILALLHWADRLESCSLVNKQFRRCATAATVSVTLSAVAANQSRSLNKVREDGHQVSSLHITPRSPHGPLDAEHAWPLPTAVLHQLPYLQVLQLAPCVNVYDAFWQQLPCVADLRELGVSVCSKTPLSTVTAALTQLQRLNRLSLVAKDFIISKQTAPELQQLTNLQQLRLDASVLHPEFLLPFTGLVDLQLTGGLGAPAQDDTLREHGVSAATTALFVVLSRLTALTRLAISSTTPLAAREDMASCAPQWPQDLPSGWDAFAAFTSSSKLQHLQLSLQFGGTESGSSPMLGAISHSNLQLPDIETLSLQNNAGCGLHPCIGPMQAQGLSRLTTLHTLSIDEFVLQPGFEQLVSHPVRLRKLQLRRVSMADTGTGEGLLHEMPYISHCNPLTCLEIDSDTFTMPASDGTALPFGSNWPPLPPEHFADRLAAEELVGMRQLCGSVWRYMFSLPNNVLPYIEGTTCRHGMPAPMWHTVCVDTAAAAAMGFGFMTKDTLGRFVDEYPMLRSRSMRIGVEKIDDLSALCHLKGLTELAIGHASAATVTALVAACSSTSSLKTLHLWFYLNKCGNECAAPDLSPLAALTQLTRLTVGCYCKTGWRAGKSHSSSSSSSSPNPGVLIEAFGPTTSSSGQPVWRQLLRHCHSAYNVYAGVEDVVSGCMIS